LRKTYRVALGLSLVALLVGFGYWFTTGISGEVFLLAPDGKPESAPGAEVHIYKSDDKHSLQAFLAGPLNLQQSWKELDAKVPQTSLELSDHRLRLIQMLVYVDIFTKVSDYWPSVATRTNTDRNGQFTVRLAPGKYLIHVSGQAGKSRAHWLREVQVVWRADTRLSTPIYSYEPE
jgi:hypothetical protein